MDEAPNDHDRNEPDPSPIDSVPVDTDSDELGAEQRDEAPPIDGLVTGRDASVRFSRAPQANSARSQVRMDAANQSLADALRITYGFLQVAMVVLLILFVFSGFQKINEGERGISVFLGKPARTQLEPGAHLTWPYPIGELIRIGGGAVEIPIARIFMPNKPGATSDDALLDTPIDQFNNAGRLNPGRDGSLITADLNIAHTQWTVNYHRSNHLRFVENILPEQERTVIVVAARRAVIQVIAETTIDDLLKKSAETIAAKVREITQHTLDGFGSGITVDRIVLVRKSPPLYLLDQFAKVQSAAQNAGKAREDALLERDQKLNQIAGRSASVLISMIDEYEQFIELDEQDQANDLLAKIDTVLGGGETSYQGQETLGLVSGEVSEILNQSQSKASARVSQAIADLEQFRAKQAQFAANPRLMIARDWSMAMNEFLNKDFVSTMYLPLGVDAELLINNDPEIDRERDRLRKRDEALEAMRERKEEFKRDLYRSQRGIVPKDAP